MNEIKAPTIGRIVHVFHNQDGDRAMMMFPHLYYAAKEDPIAGIVVKVSGSNVNLQLFMNGEMSKPAFLFDVRHKTEAKPGLPYWDYPEIK